MSETDRSFGSDLDDLARRCEAWRQAGDRLVTTNGCFDILHAGHIHTLLGARAEGDRLIVGLNSDSSVRALKGEDRPMVPEKQRAATLAALPFVDHVQIFTQERPDRIFEVVRPDVHVKGGDYVASELPEHDLITGLGGRLVIISEVPGPHSSDLLAAYRQRTAT